MFEAHYVCIREIDYFSILSRIKINIIIWRVPELENLKTTIEDRTMKNYYPHKTLISQILRIRRLSDKCDASDVNGKLEKFERTDPKAFGT